MFSNCPCCYPQKPVIRKATGWWFWTGDQVGEPIPDFWYVQIGGYPRGNYTTWERAMEAACLYLTKEINP